MIRLSLPRPVLSRAQATRATYADARLHLAALSMVAGCIHAVVAAPHFGEYWLFGALFVALAALQLAWGALVWERPSRGVYLAGLVLNLGVIAVWIVSRTVGLPLGPEAGSPEQLGALDFAASIIEALVALLCVAFLRTGGASPGRKALQMPVRAARWLALASMCAGLCLLVLGAGHHA
jgi:hypothetical protein